MINKKEIEKIFSKISISDYKWIKAKDIKVANWVRVKCKFGCADYGLSVCPPNVPEVNECKAFFSEYENAILIRFNFHANKNEYPKDYSKQLTTKLLNLERHIFLLGFQKAFIFNQTCCGVCNTCVNNRLDCKNLSKSRPSMEAFAIDVFDTVRNAGFDIKVIDKKESDINRYALLMID